MIDYSMIKPCDNTQADYILMKIKLQNSKCNNCHYCIGETCDIYTSYEEQASLGKYLINKKINNN